MAQFTGPADSLDESKAKRSVRRCGLACLLSLVSAVGFCIGCTEHETHTWGQLQDTLTHVLALGAYLSLLIVTLALVVLVNVAVRSDS
jgi:hypothetical protein